MKRESVAGNLPDFHRALEQWFAEHGRRLPWRDARDPYAVMVSEFMLQQTTVAAVKPFYKRWMSTFPSVESLALAKEELVLKLWQGLGYYSRARNLHRAAQLLLRERNGSIPKTLVELRTLPGVGAYTAAAIAAFAYDECVPVLDANITRVVARLFNFHEPIAPVAARRELEKMAATLLPLTGGSAHTSALMDLGAMVCRSGTPACAECPVAAFCSAENPRAIPNKPPRAELTNARDARGLAWSGEGICLVPSPGPRWRGLWTLPPCEVSDGELLLEGHYFITRYRVTLEVRAMHPEAHWQSFLCDSLPPMPSPHRRALDQILHKNLQKRRLSPKSS